MAAKWKTIPLFISSTFRDMHAERDELNNVVFPAISERLKAHRCRLEPIDLRVGVETDSTQTECERELQILKVCLAEIERSRPFLLVLLGDRYGWVPGNDRIDAASGEAGFTPEDNGGSVTALEIEYGLLKKDPVQQRRCLLCLREPLPYNQMPEETAVVYSDAYAADPGAPDRVRRLQKLKKKMLADPELAAHRHPYRLDWNKTQQRPETEGENGIRAWGQKVEAALWDLLDRETQEFAAQKEPTWQEEEQFAIEEFTERLNDSFVGREAIVQQTLDLAASPAAESAMWGLCLTGETGRGKSALFARLYHELSRLPDILLLSHAAGISPRAGQTEWMLRRWIGELGETLGETPDMPEDIKPEELEKLFAQLLHRLAVDRRVVVLVDALNQFIRTDRARAVSWLPSIWPENARFIATAIPGEETLHLVHRNGLKLFEIPALDITEASNIAAKVYGRYHRRPNAEVLRTLLGLRLPDGTAAAGNPLWLTLALDLLNQLDADDFSTAEAGGGGSAEEKLKRFVLIRSQSLPPDVESLYSEMIIRVEKIVGKEETRAFVALLALSRNGWREEDFQSLLPRISEVFAEAADTPLRMKDRLFEWNALRFAVLRRCFRNHVLQHGNLEQWDFAHATMRQAAYRHLQIDSDVKKQIHGCILDYLDSLATDSPIVAQEKTFHIVAHRNTHRTAIHFVQVVQRVLPLNVADAQRQAESVANAIVEPNIDDLDASITEWLISMIKNGKQKYTHHIAAFVVFLLDGLLAKESSSAFRKIREKLLLAAQASVDSLYDDHIRLRKMFAPDKPSHSSEQQAKLDQVDQEWLRIGRDTKDSFSSVIQRKLSAIYRNADLHAARQANLRSFWYSTDFERRHNSKKISDPNIHIGSDFSVFDQMVDDLNKGEVLYLLPSLMALYRDAELLQAQAKHTDAIDRFSAVWKGADRIKGFFDPTTEKLRCGSRMQAGESLLACNSPHDALKLFYESKDILERGCAQILENANKPESVTHPQGRTLKEDLKVPDGQKMSWWPAPSEWSYFIALASWKVGDAKRACESIGDARDEYQQAEKILSGLLSKDPGNNIYQSSMAMVRSEIASCFVMQGSAYDALNVYNKSVGMFEGHPKGKNENRHDLHNILRALFIGEIVYLAAGNEANARSIREQRQKLSGTDEIPEYYSLPLGKEDEWSVSDNEYIFTILARIQNNSIANWKRMVFEKGDALSECNGQLKFLQDSGSPEGAAKLIEKMEHLIEGYPLNNYTNPPLFQMLLSDGYTSLGNYFFDQKQHNRSLQMYQKALRMRRRVESTVRTAPANIIYAKNIQSLKKYAEATLSKKENAVPAAAGLSSLDCRKALSISCGQVGDVLSEKQCWSVAAEYYAEGQQILKELIAECPDNPSYEQTLAATLERLTKTFFHQKKYADALYSCEEAIDVLKNLRQKKKLPAARLQFLANDYFIAGDIHRCTGNIEKAEEKIYDGYRLLLEMSNSSLGRQGDVEGKIYQIELAYPHFTSCRDKDDVTKGTSAVSQQIAETNDKAIKLLRSGQGSEALELLKGELFPNLSTQMTPNASPLHISNYAVMLHLTGHIEASVSIAKQMAEAGMETRDSKAILKWSKSLTTWQQIKLGIGGKVKLADFGDSPGFLTTDG